MSFTGSAFVLAIIAMSTIGWIVTTWIRARHGYPIENEWSGVVHRTDNDADRKIALLSADNEKLAGQISRLEERIAVLRTDRHRPVGASGRRDRRAALSKGITDMDKLAFFEILAPTIAVVGVAGVLGWVITTWLRIKNGYPLEGSWGNAVYPRTDQESIERIKLLSQENAQLRAELGSIKDRLANVERIVTDSAHSLDREIEQLRGRAAN